MRPSEINKVMDLAEVARETDMNFTPCIVGAPGVAKSAIIQQWGARKGYRLIDIRLALREAPDLLGFPKIVEVNGMQRQVNITPDFWPMPGEKCLVFIDEVNRGNQSVMNAIMQLLTDRKIGSHYIGKESIIVAAINPEDEQNDVNTMDSALKDRLEFFFVEYNKSEHVDYMRSAGYNEIVINWVQTGTWSYCRPEDVGSVSGAKYLSPRTLEKLNTAIVAMEQVALRTGKKDQAFEMVVYNNILGQIQGASFYQFKHNETPVTYKELKDGRSRAKSLAKIKSFSDPQNFKAGSISMTVEDIIKDSTVDDDLLTEVILSLPADQAHYLIYGLQRTRLEQAKELDKKKNTDTNVKNSDGTDDKLLKRLFTNKKIEVHFKSILNDKQ